MGEPISLMLAVRQIREEYGDDTVVLRDTSTGYVWTPEVYLAELARLDLRESDLTLVIRVVTGAQREALIKWDAWGYLFGGDPILTVQPANALLQ